jgi:hypothetical protein
MMMMMFLNIRGTDVHQEMSYNVHWIMQQCISQLKVEECMPNSAHITQITNVLSCVRLYA